MTKVTLKRQEFKDLSADDIAKLLKERSDVSEAHLDLYKHDLSSKSTEDLVIMLSAISPGTEVRLNWSTLATKPIKEVLKLFKAMEHLSIIGPSFYMQPWLDKPIDEIQALLANLPSAFSELDYRANDHTKNSLAKMDTDQTVAIIKATPSTIHALNMSNSCLLNCSSLHIKDILCRIPPQVRTLQLGGNELVHTHADELSDVLATMPQTVTTLDASALDYAPPGVYMYGQGPNSEYKYDGLPSHITTLSYRWDQTLRRLNLDDFDAFLAGIPPFVTIVDLGMTNVEDIAGTQEIGDVLIKTAKHIRLIPNSQIVISDELQALQNYLDLAPTRTFATLSRLPRDAMPKLGKEAATLFAFFSPNSPMPPEMKQEVVSLVNGMNPFGDS